MPFLNDNIPQGNFGVVHINLLLLLGFGETRCSKTMIDELRNFLLLLRLRGIAWSQKKIIFLVIFDGLANILMHEVKLFILIVENISSFRFEFVLNDIAFAFSSFRIKIYFFDWFLGSFFFLC